MRSGTVPSAPHRRARVEPIEAAAEALIRDLGYAAYHEARRRERGASSDAIADDWALVARAIVRKTGSRVGLNISAELEMNTFSCLTASRTRRASLIPIWSLGRNMNRSELPSRLHGHSGSNSSARRPILDDRY
jgi:hypothetical protein